jgi:SAM-dependent methyltransferase
MKQALSADIGENAGGEIRAQPCPRCYLCQSSGEMLYQNLSDKLFGAPGEWNLRRCPKPECGLLWLDPMPLEEDIGKAYESYHTHQDFEDRMLPPPVSLRHRAAELCRSAYLACRFNYGHTTRKPFHWLLALPILLSRIECDGLDLPLRYLAGKKRGRMLDVGCGNGSTLKLAQELGWNVQGVDFDARAVDASVRKGLDVRLGRLTDQRYPATSFDLILLSHVIEHVHDPLVILKEIHRLLTPGGILAATTPNAESWGHRHFGADWRGLEPPRHLQLFNRRSIETITHDAGFDRVILSTTLRSTPYIFIQSSRARSGQSGSMRPSTQSEAFYGRLASVAELLMGIWRPLVAEELLLEARK